MPNVRTKSCRVCGEEKPWTEFSGKYHPWPKCHACRTREATGQGEARRPPEPSHPDTHTGQHTSAQASEQHRNNLNEIVDTHFNEAKERAASVYLQHLVSPTVVLSRHWRHRGDIPKELATLPRSVWNTLKSVIPRNGESLDGQTATITLSGKQRELQNTLENELLDLSGLDKKLEEYVAHYQSDFDAQLHALLSGLPNNQREQVKKQLSLHVDRMSLPVEGSREALMFFLTGLIGKGLGSSAFGSSVATGQAAAVTIYTSNLSWWGGLLVSLNGVPGWVGIIGASSGFLAALIVAPLFAPLLEVGVNRLRGEKMLLQIIDNVRTRVITPAKDSVDVLGQLAVYLQLIPDLIYFAAKIKP